MSSEMPYADILILALVAGFILLRLRSVLGNKTGYEDRPDAPPRALGREVEEKIVQVADRLKRQIPAEITLPEAAQELLVEEPARAGIDQIRASDPSFRADQFLEGAKGAFEMVFTAFDKGDKATLKNLLSDPLFQTFSQEIDLRAANPIKQENTLVAIDSAKITAAEKDRVARITVRFISEQISVERNAEGAIVGGNASSVEKVEDEWSFERDLSSRNPNWKVIDT